jgi:hypothetical protein
MSFGDATVSGFSLSSANFFDCRQSCLFHEDLIWRLRGRAEFEKGAPATTQRKATLLRLRRP